MRLIIFISFSKVSDIYGFFKNFFCFMFLLTVDSSDYSLASLRIILFLLEFVSFYSVVYD